MELFNKLMVGLLPLVPKSVVGKLSARYIAGDTRDQALDEVQSLNQQGFMATLDILGEFVTDPGAAEATARDYVELLQAIHRRGLDANVSVKLTQLGLAMDPELCYRLIHTVAMEARSLNSFVRLDMEDSECTQPTLDIYHRLRRETPQVGCVIQAYLKRSAADIEALAAGGGNVRLCKGIYVEPETIAIKDPAEINRNFVRLLDTLLRHRVYTGIATHDQELVEAAYGLIAKYKLQPHEYEFQMLLGVTEGLRRSIVDGGHRLRVYVPYGSQWYEYSVRRLKENPQIAGYAAKGILTRGR